MYQIDLSKIKPITKLKSYALSMKTGELLFEQMHPVGVEGDLFWIANDKLSSIYFATTLNILPTLLNRLNKFIAENSNNIGFGKREEFKIGDQTCSFSGVRPVFNRHAPQYLSIKIIISQESLYKDQNGKERKRDRGIITINNIGSQYDELPLFLDVVEKVLKAVETSSR